MADIQTQLPIKITDGSDTVAITSHALNVTGTVTIPSTVTVSNFPDTQTVAGTVSVGNFPATQPVSGTVAVGSPSVTVTNFPATQTVAGTITSTPSGTQTVEGTVSVGNFPATQPVSGTVAVGSPSVTVTNFPATQTVSGTVTSAPSGTQTVEGTVSVGNFPATQTIAGTVTIGDTITVQGEPEITDGIVCVQTTSTEVAHLNTVTIPYTVTSGKSLYLKGVMASASGGPCKVYVKSTVQTYGTGFFSAAGPYLDMRFAQPPKIPQNTVVNIYFQNNGGAAQDLYCTLFGHEQNS